jgi:hypothetical protein
MDTTTVPPRLVTAVALILLVLAGLGVYQGWRRSGLGDTDSGDAGLLTLTAPGAAAAKTASALADPSALGLNEAQVREIARQEARAALGQPRTPPVPVSSEGEAPSHAAAKPVTPGPAPATPPRPATTQPALQTPAAPAQPAEGGSQAPLF